MMEDCDVGSRNSVSVDCDQLNCQVHRPRINRRQNQESMRD